MLGKYLLTMMRTAAYSNGFNNHVPHARGLLGNNLANCDYSRYRNANLVTNQDHLPLNYYN